MLKSSFRVVLALSVVGVFAYEVSLATMQVAAVETASTTEQTVAGENVLQQLTEEADEKQFSCEELVSRIDQEIIRIDEAMLTQVGDESALLQQRAEFVDYRLAQPCHGDVVTAVEPVVDELFCDECVEEIPCDVVEEEFLPDGGYGECCSSAGGFGGGGGGGGGGIGGGAGLLGLAGLAGLAGLDDDDDDGVRRVSL